MPLPACYATAAVAHAYQRLGEIWEERGRVDRAAEYYGRLVSLMKEPDPALRPRVELATRALERLTKERASTGT
jgi:hypothetical protein